MSTNVMFTILDGTGSIYVTAIASNIMQSVISIVVILVLHMLSNLCMNQILQILWLVGCFGFNGPLKQYMYFSLYRAVSQREGERGERIDESKNVQTTPPIPTASAIDPCPTVIKIVGRPGS